MRIVRTLGVLAVLCGAVEVVSAQAPPDTSMDRPLTLTGSVSAGHDTDITASEVGRQPGIGAGASFAGSALALSYSGGTPERNFYASGLAQHRYYRANQTLSAPLGTGQTGIGLAVSRRLRVSGSLMAGYFPEFQISVLPPTTTIAVDVPHPTLDYSISSAEAVSYQGAAMATFSLTNRSSVNIQYGAGRFRYLDDAYRLNTYTVGAGYSRNLTRYATLQLGYSEYTARYVSPDGLDRNSFVGRSINAGIDYSRPLSLSRRTTVSFSTGSTALDDQTRTQYTITGNAMLNHRLARWWNLGLAYSRQFEFVGGFSQPLLGDSVMLTLRGGVPQRANVQLSSGYLVGKLGLDADARNYRSLQSSARVDFPMPHRLGLFGQYVYYRNVFDRSVVLPVGLPQRINRQSVSAGLTIKII